MKPLILPAVNIRETISANGGARTRRELGRYRTGIGHEKPWSMGEVTSMVERPALLIEPVTVRAAVAAQMLGISRPKLYELAAREDFHGAFKLDGCTLFSVEALKEWVKAQCGGEQNA